MEPALTLAAEAIAVTLGGKPVLRDVSLELRDGERVALLGPSGSGKSTLLRALAGLQPVAAGRVVLDGEDITLLPTHRRGIGLVFQDGALFPHRDVGGNVGFGLDRSLETAERAAHVREALALVGLEGTEPRDPATLSGGESQRVALARALASRPRVLLLDEPLGALDGPLRERLQDDLRVLFDHLGLTVLHVTHDVSEAFALGTRVALLRDGRIVQADSPELLWRYPADVWVAEFIGLGNIRDGRVVRPEAVRVTRSAAGNAIVCDTRRRGPLVELRVRLDSGEELEAATIESSPPRAGERVEVTIDPAGIVEFGEPA